MQAAKPDGAVQGSSNPGGGFRAAIAAAEVRDRRPMQLGVGHDHAGIATAGERDVEGIEEEADPITRSTQ